MSHPEQWVIVLKYQDLFAVFSAKRVVMYIHVHPKQTAWKKNQLVHLYCCFFLPFSSLIKTRTLCTWATSGNAAYSSDKLMSPSPLPPPPFPLPPSPSPFPLPPSPSPLPLSCSLQTAVSTATVIGRWNWSTRTALTPAVFMAMATWLSHSYVGETWWAHSPLKNGHN